MSPLDVETTADPGYVDRLLSVLASHPLRLALAYFEQTSEETASLADLAAYVVAEGGATDPENARLSLYHRDLPKLAAVGLVDYDPRTRTVSYRGPPAAVEHDEWSQYLARGRIV